MCPCPSQVFGWHTTMVPLLLGHLRKTSPTRVMILDAIDPKIMVFPGLRTLYQYDMGVSVKWHMLGPKSSWFTWGKQWPATPQSPGTSVYIYIYLYTCIWSNTYTIYGGFRKDSKMQRAFSGLVIFRRSWSFKNPTMMQWALRLDGTRNLPLHQWNIRDDVVCLCIFHKR